MIKSFRHKGVERFFLKGIKAGIQTAHAAKLGRQLQRWDVARRPQNMNVPGWKLDPLKGDWKGHWAAWVSLRLSHQGILGRAHRQLAAHAAQPPHRLADLTPIRKSPAST